MRFAVHVIQLINLEILAAHFCIAVAVTGMNLKITVFTVFPVRFETLNCAFWTRSMYVCVFRLVLSIKLSTAL